MAVTNAQILEFLKTPNLTDAQIATAMQEFSVTPAQMAQAVGLPSETVRERYVAIAPDTNTTENINKLASQILSQGTTEAWTGGLPPEKAALYMASDLAKSGVTNIEQITKGDTGIINAMTGEKLVSGYGERTGGNLWSGSYEGKGNTGFGVNFDAQGKPVFYTQGASSSTLKNDVLKLAAVAGAVYGLGGFEGLLGGAGTTGLTLAELGGTAGAGALTVAESAALYGTGASALGTAGVIGSDLAGLSGIPAGTGALTAAESAALFGTGGAGLMGTGTGLTVAGAGGLGGATGAAGLGGSLGTGLTTAGAGGLGGLTGAAGLGGSLGAGLTTAGGLVAGNTLLGGAGLGTTLAGLGTGVGGSLLGSTVGSTLGSTLANTATSTLGRGLTSGSLANLFSGGLGTAGSLLQMQQSKEAALAAQQRIDAETAAAKQAAQFRPIGMTTRFGTSQFQVDPVTGQLTSAGYTLSPEAKNAQDRLVKLAESGLQQAEGAQAQFAPLQTGAQNLFNLGNQYLAQSPQDVAQNYLNQQMALLQPGRELELANLQTKLRNQGRMGLSVSQGGNLGATTPELQALYNARAQQEAQLAANAQQYGQQNVAFGAGLLGTGAQTMGQYYGGQQAAYAPYTTALGQVQGLEALGQQPLTTGINLGQISSQAGANVGRLGLTGAQLSTNLATGADATRNLAAQGLIAAGNPNAQFGQALGGLFGGGLQSAFSGTGLGSSGFGTGLAYGNQDLGLYL